MTNPKLITISYLLAVAAIFSGLTFFGLRRIPDSAQHVADFELPIHRSQPVDQTVTPGHDGLSTVLIFFRNPNLVNTDPLVFSLTDFSGQLLRQISLSGRNIGDRQTVRLQFPPLPDSKGLIYHIQLTAPDTAPDAPVPLSVAFSKADVYPGGRVLIPAGISGDLSFQLFYSPQSKSALAFELYRLFLSRINIKFIMIIIVIFFTSLRFGKPRIPEDQRSL